VAFISLYSYWYFRKYKEKMISFSLEGSNERQRRHPSSKMEKYFQTKIHRELGIKEYLSFWKNVCCEEPLEDHTTYRFMVACNQIKVLISPFIQILDKI